MTLEHRELGAVCQVAPRDPALSADSPFIPMGAVQVGTRFPTYSEARGARGGVRARAGDVLFARITPCLENGKVAQLPRSSMPSGGSTEFIVIRPGNLVDPAYLYYWCLEPGVRDQAKAMMTGTTGRMRLGAKDLATFRLPLPGLAEQRRIVEILEDHLSHLDAAKRGLRETNGRLTNLDEAAIRVHITTDCRSVPLLSLLESPLTNGRSVPSRDGGFPVLRLTALKESGVDISERKTGDWSRVEASRFLVRKGDFLIARGNGSLRLVGRGSLVRLEPDEVAFPDTAIRVRPRTGVMLPEFLDVVWNSRQTREQIEAIARTSAGIYKVNQSQLERIELPLVPIADQRRVLASLGQITGSRVRLRSAIKLAELHELSLRRAVLAAAFEGKLTGRHTDAEVIEEAAERQEQAT